MGYKIGIIVKILICKIRDTDEYNSLSKKETEFGRKGYIKKAN